MSEEVKGGEKTAVLVKPIFATPAETTKYSRFGRRAHRQGPIRRQTPVVIGITTSLSEDGGGDGGTRQVLDRRYVEAVERSGGCPLVVPITETREALAPDRVAGRTRHNRRRRYSRRSLRGVAGGSTRGAGGAGAGGPLDARADGRARQTGPGDLLRHAGDDDGSWRASRTCSRTRIRERGRNNRGRRFPF